MPAGIAVCQLLVIKSKIPKFEIGWEDLKSRNGSFGSTGNNFEQVQANLCRVEHENVHLVRNNVLGAIDLIDPREINLGNINLKFLGNNEKRADQLTELLDFEKKTFCNYNAILEKIPTIESTHGLLVVDLFSMYLSFYPLKSKSSGAVSKAIRDYISHFCVPKFVYSDCDQSLRGEVEQLFYQYNITHHTSYPYTQKQNTVEGHVRMFKNSYRSALMESDVFKHRDWDFLYPLVITRLNGMISKYGISREAVQFGNISENNLPLITDSVLFEPLEEELDNASKLFKARVGKFINKKKANKQYY